MYEYTLHENRVKQLKSNTRMIELDQKSLPIRYSSIAYEVCIMLSFPGYTFFYFICYNKVVTRPNPQNSPNKYYTPGQ